METRILQYILKHGWRSREGRETKIKPKRKELRQLTQLIRVCMLINQNIINTDTKSNTFFYKNYVFFIRKLTKFKESPDVSFKPHNVLNVIFNFFVVLSSKMI